MAGIVSATFVQVVDARNKVLKMEQMLQAMVGGQWAGPVHLSAGQVSAIDAAVDAAVAAVALINT